MSDEPLVEKVTRKFEPEELEAFKADMLRLSGEVRDLKAAKKKASQATQVLIEQTEAAFWDARDKIERGFEYLDVPALVLYQAADLAPGYKRYINALTNETIRDAPLTLEEKQLRLYDSLESDGPEDTNG